jgi:hypothetical protein
MFLPHAVTQISGVSIEDIVLSLPHGMMIVYCFSTVHQIHAASEHACLARVRHFTCAAVAVDGVKSLPLRRSLEPRNVRVG